MNANAVARYYDRLTPEERFRLIVAAGARGDQAEHTRLVSSSRPLTLRMSDHGPYGRAFHLVALVVFIDLLEQAAAYLEALERADNPNLIGEDEHRASGSRWADMALAAGFILRTMADGWKLFCTRLTIPPFALWEALPGFDRLQHAVAITEAKDDLRGVAFTTEEMLHWLNDVRPKGQPAPTTIALTAESFAHDTEELFRRGVAWNGGVSECAAGGHHPELG